MNKAILMGRLTRDPELRTTSNQVAVATFTLAVDRRFKNANGERQADFIQCVAWRQQAELIGKYFQKGSLIAVVGEIQTGTWDADDGTKKYATEVVVSEIHFTGKKEQGDSSPAQESGNGFFPAPDDDSSTVLPFDL